MTDLAEAVEPIRGCRKALVYVGMSVGCLVTAHETSPHRDLGFAQNTGRANLSAGTGEAANASVRILCNGEISQAVRELTRAGTVVYSLDPRGGLHNPAWVSPTVDGRGGPGADRERMSLVEARRPSVFDGFNVLADRTGGFAVSGTSAFNPVLDRIVLENSSYYVVGYYSTNETANGEFRKNEIKLSQDRLKAFYRPATSRHVEPKNLKPVFLESAGGIIHDSTTGGTEPVWARDGRELFYRAPNGAVMRVSITPGSTWTASAPTQLFAATSYALAAATTGGTSRTYDVSPDGRRFLMMKNSDAPTQTSTAPRIIVVQNWVEELKRRVPTK
jgi:hypothetical protein